ncbi:MAG: PEGA domain-containing protein [Myxococcales bacterium]|nr:MAG: PEGA domain-containing protein [Myxococcales bacterium]
MIRSSASALVVLVCSLSPALAHAEEAAPAPAAAANAPDAAAKQEAARRFGSAIKLYEDGDYQLALAEFERVYELVPDYRVLYNIGQVSMQLGRYARALRTLREYMGRGGDAVPSDRRSAVRADIEVLETRTATLTLDIQPAGTEVWIDGVLIGQAPLAQAVVVDVGERTVQARRRGFVGRTQAITLAGSDQRQLVLALEPEPKTAPSGGPALVGPSPAGPRTAAPTRESKSRPVLWVGWGTTATLAAGSAIAAVLGASAASNLRDLRDARTATRDALDQEHDRAAARFLVADVLGVAAVAAGATTLYFQLSGSRERERAPQQARLGFSVLPNGVSLRVEH